jgi:ribosomal-protein-alanine N-acetyltransferase
MTPERMAAIHALCFETPRPWNAAEFEGFLSDPNCLIHHRVDSGFLIGRLIADEAEVLTLAVHPNTRRQGIARELMEVYVKDLRSKHAEQIFLEVVASNEAAIALYSGIGFAKAGRRPKYYRTPTGDLQDALILRADLAPGK